MKLSISNIAWTTEQDGEVFALMRKHGFSGLEIAPTRIFPEQPYERIDEAAAWKARLYGEWGFELPSMQSIWFGRSERIFGSAAERVALRDYTFAAIRFAEAIGCGNLVFGCPRNRCIPEGSADAAAVTFFRELGDYACAHNTVIGMEANPPIYNTNYINGTGAALDLIRRVNSPGFRLNLDVGAMVHNGEDVAILVGSEALINHVHISEPGLKPIADRQLHRRLAALLENCGYSGYVSIEMGKGPEAAEIDRIMGYVEGVFHAKS